MPRESRVVRAIPLWLLRAYLEEGGGRATDERTVAGDGWTARLTQVADFTVGSLRVGQVRLDLEGTAAGLAAVRAFLEPKLMRGGG